MNNAPGSPRTRTSLSRRRLLQAAGAGLAAPLLAQLRIAHAQTLPPLPALATLLAGRVPRWERLHLDMPLFADNGQAVPLRMTMDGPFPATSALQSIHLFSERNPVPVMAIFEYPVAPDRVEIDTRVRLAGAQRIVAIAVMSDAATYAASVDVEVTIAGCLDAS
jgi:sulfur-oxidizing protein SoxY